jgi:hypothetical protein
MPLAALWKSVMFQRDFFRYVASMRIQYDQAFSCASCAAQGGVSRVTLDGTTIGMPRGLVVNVPLEPGPDAEAKPTTDQCVLLVSWGVTHKDARSVSKRVFLYGKDVDAARLYIKSLATGATVNSLEYDSLLGFLNKTEIPRYTDTCTDVPAIRGQSDRERSGAAQDRSARLSFARPASCGQHLTRADRELVRALYRALINISLILMSSPAVGYAVVLASYVYMLVTCLQPLSVNHNREFWQTTAPEHSCMRPQTGSCFPRFISLHTTNTLFTNTTCKQRTHTNKIT